MTNWRQQVNMHAVCDITVVTYFELEVVTPSVTLLLVAGAATTCTAAAALAAE